MSIYLRHPTAGPGASPVTLTLPGQLVWADEFSWRAVKQTIEYSTTGAMVVDAWAKLAGRSITLRGDVDRAWCDRDTLATLRDWSAQPGRSLILGLGGVERPVIFDHEAGAIEASAVIAWADPQPTDPYTVTIRFLEIA